MLQEISFEKKKSKSCIPIGHVSRMTEEKSHADWTNRHILEQTYRGEKRQNCQFPFF